MPIPLTSYLIFLMIPLAIAITSVQEINEMIRYYKYQSFFLAFLTIMTAVLDNKEDPLIVFILIAFAIVIPFLLGIIIEPLLARATIAQDEPWFMRIWNSLIEAFSNRQKYPQSPSEAAKIIWAQHPLTTKREYISIGLSPLLVTLAYWMVIRLFNNDAQTMSIKLLLIVFGIVLSFSLSRRLVSIVLGLIITGALYFTSKPLANFISTGAEQSLAVALSLLLLGIFMIISRQDLISQIIGLLVTDHGLFLAATRLLSKPPLVIPLVISLFLYILITLVILTVLLPDLRKTSRTLEVGDQTELKG